MNNLENPDIQLDVDYSKSLFESLMIYLACWSSENWKLADLYGEKGFVSGKKESLYANTINRIKKLQENGVPISYERLDKNRPKKSGIIVVNHDQITSEFTTQNNLTLDVEKTILNEVIETAIPLLRIQFKHYYEGQDFTNNILKKIIIYYTFLFEKCTVCIKYFPILISFLYAINSEDGLTSDHKYSEKWVNTLSASSKLGLDRKLILFFLSKIPGMETIMSPSGINLSLSSLILRTLTETESDIRIEKFKETIKSTRRIIPFYIWDNETYDYLYLLRFPKGSWDEHIPDRLDYYLENKEELFQRFKIINQMFLNLFVKFLLVENIDYKGVMKMDYEIPVRNGRRNIPMKLDLKTVINNE